MWSFLMSIKRLLYQVLSLTVFAERGLSGHFLCSGKKLEFDPCITNYVYADNDC